MKRPKAFKYITITCLIAALIAGGYIYNDYLKEEEAKKSVVLLDKLKASEAEDTFVQNQGSVEQDGKNSSQEPVQDENKQDNNLKEDVKESEINKEESSNVPVASTPLGEKDKVSTNNSTSTPKDTTDIASPKPAAEAPPKPKEEPQPVKEEPKESAPAPEVSVVLEDNKVEQPPKESTNTSPTYLPSNYAFSYKEAIENEVIILVNALRKENGIPALSYDSSLRESARYKSNSMLQHQYFSHSNPQLGGKSMSYLLWDVFKINSTRVGENIAYYQGPNEKITARQIYDQWYNSASHREAMLSTGFTRIGVGIVVSSIGEASSYMYGTQHFAR